MPATIICNDQREDAKISPQSPEQKTKNDAFVLSPNKVDVGDLTMEISHRSLLLPIEQDMVDIEKPHHHDVLCGRGVTTNRHPGNESFRSLVSLNKELYVTSTKRQKMSISRSIVEAVRSLDPPGRFLEKNPSTGLWSDIGDKKAVEKTSQALRDGAANLRKQLSADLGDPDFLNAVFDMDVDKDQKKSEKKDKKEDGDGNDDDVDDEKKKNESETEKSSPAKGKEKEKDKDKIRASDKVKPAKAKPAPVKKGHRRTKSTPCATSLVPAKTHRRQRVSYDAPMTPSTHINRSGPPSSHSPRLQPSSQPTSPMVTWRVRGGFSPEGKATHFRPYDAPSPSHFSPFGAPGGHMSFSRSYSYDYQYPHHSRPIHGPPPPPPPPSSSDYRHDAPPTHMHTSPTAHWYPPPRYHHHYHSTGSYHAPPHSDHHSDSGKDEEQQIQQQQPPPSPLPPGRHQFSPKGYHSNPHAMEWSPRDMHHHRTSPRQYTPRSDHGVGRSPAWRHSHSPQEQYLEASVYSETDSSGLAVPSLGCEGKRVKLKMSTRIPLTPRSRSTYNHYPPRPPSSALPRDFTPPPPSPRFARRRDGPLSPASRSRDDDHHHLDPSSATMSSDSKMKKSAATPQTVASSVRSSSSSKNPNDSEDEHRTSPGMFNREPLPYEPGDDYHPYDEGSSTAVDDIPMSPIPFEGEDPRTLMELPENILTLPISPCGPYDDPVAHPPAAAPSHSTKKSTTTPTKAKTASTTATATAAAAAVKSETTAAPG